VPYTKDTKYFPNINPPESVGLFTKNPNPPQVESAALLKGNYPESSGGGGSRFQKAIGRIPSFWPIPKLGKQRFFLPTSASREKTNFF